MIKVVMHKVAQKPKDQENACSAKETGLQGAEAYKYRVYLRKILALTEQGNNDGYRRV